MNGKKPELLAPAGDIECLETALAFGADAVYVGGSLLQLRAASAEFSDRELELALKLTHDAGKKLYVTVNSFAKNEEIPLACEYAKKLSFLGVDAAIIADMGVFSAFRESAPELNVHISTQANCLNYKAAELYSSLGASRVVLGREATLAEIREMKSLIPSSLEIEAFVHGAMCMSYSGRCLISSYLTGRSGNRGECTQPCRWEYYLMEQKRPNEFFQISEENGHTSILSSHDMKAIDILPELASAGVSSFKIEGRMKTPYYVATVVNAYRRAIDGTVMLPELERELLAVSHRPYSHGFYLGELEKNTFNDGLYHYECIFAGVALEPSHDGQLTLMQRNRFAVGDTLEVISPVSFGQSFTVESINNEEGESVEAAPHPKETVTVNCPLTVHKGDLLRKRL